MRTGLTGTTVVVHRATGPPSPLPDDELPPPEEDPPPGGGAPPLLDELGPTCPPLLDELPPAPLLVPADPLDELLPPPLLDELLGGKPWLVVDGVLEHATIAAAPMQPAMAHAA